MMRTKLTLKFLLASAIMGFILLSACDDILEKDITKKELILIAPGDGLRTSVVSQTFWWEPIDGARSYNLQIVSPTFESVEVVMADTILKKNKFEINLFPGKFEWRIKAINGAYESMYVLRSLEIDSTLDLKAQKVILSTPSEDSYLNSVSILFKWQKLYIADTYTIEVHSSEWSGTTAYSLSSITDDTISVKNLMDGVYSWGIKGWNRNSATDFSIRKFTIDKISPSIPALISPPDRANIQQLPVNLTWNRSQDQGSPLSDSVIIGSDSAFTSNKIVLRELINDTRLDNAVSDTGTYYWKVKTVDAAHNQSQFTAKRRFKVLNK